LHLTSVVDADGNALALDRDGAGRATAIHAPFGQTTTLVYDGDGNLATATDPLGRSTALSYRSGGLLTRLVDHRGGVHAMTYDAAGRLAGDTSPALASWTLTRTSNAPVHVDVTTALGRRRGHDLQVLPDGTEHHALTYENGARVAWTRGSDGTTTTTRPDGTVATGRITSMVRPDGATVQIGHDPGDHVTSYIPPGQPAHGFAYSADDRGTSYTPPTSPATLVAYDGDQAPIRVTRGDGSTLTATRDAAGRVATLSSGATTISAGYDSAGRLASVTGPAGNALAYTHDGFLPTAVTATGAAPGVVRWTYDAPRAP
jgi:YD repeat-containing protein